MTEPAQDPPDRFGDAGDQAPLDAAESAAQIESLLELLGAGARRVLDLGCGAGRVLVPLAAAGHAVTGLDRDADALARCRAAAGADRVRLVEADFAAPWPGDLGVFDVVTCLGNTMMTLADVDDAVALLRRAAACLAPAGAFVMDDCPGACWPELTEGNWTGGISDEPRAQLVWAADDAVFALREGDRIDPASWRPRPDDRRLRLWTMGALRLAGRLAGLSAPVRPGGGGLLVMRLGQESNRRAL